jgi:hypothetical protein
VRRPHCFLLLALVALLSGLGVPVAAAAAHDGTAPTLRMDPARLVVGTSVGAADYSEPDLPEAYYYSWAARWAWTASDASGICSQSLRYNGGDPYADYPPPGFQVSPDLREYSGNIGGYDSYKGSFPGLLIVEVTDCAGNTASARVSAQFFYDAEDIDTTFTYRGAWSTARSASSLIGTTHTTVQKGASVSRPVQGGLTGLVMITGPARGAVAVLLDGRRIAVVDTYAATRQYRTVVWQRLLPAGSHTLTLVNLATPGRPRVDLDAIINPGNGGDGRA